MSNYSDQLKDPRWQKKRLEIMQRDNFSCKSCYDDELTLNVHHKRYIKDLKPWEYENEDLITLCENCHKTIQETKDKIYSLLDSHLYFENGTDLLQFLQIVNKVKPYNLCYYRIIIENINQICNI